jgi:hypothetical protein
MFSVSTQQIPEHQQPDWQASARDERINSAATVVSFVRASFVLQVCRCGSLSSVFFVNKLHVIAVPMFVIVFTCFVKKF